MLNIAICDDDIQTTGRMDMLLQEIAKRNFMDVEIEWRESCGCGCTGHIF